MPAIKISLEVCQQIALVWNPSIPFAELGRQFGVDSDTIRRALKRVGKYKPRSNPQYSEHEREWIGRLVKEGKTSKQISDEVGRPYYGIQNYIRANFGKRARGRPMLTAPQSKILPEHKFGNSQWLSMSLRSNNATHI